MHFVERPDELRRILKTLDPAAPPKALFLRRAPEGVRGAGQSLSVMSASFNPPTEAHLRMAEMAARTFALDEILLLLARTNVDKGLYGAPLDARMLMLDALVRDRPTYSAAVVNRARFVDKLEALRPLYPAGVDIRFVVGYDTLVRLFDPKYYEDMNADLERMFASCRVVAVNRADHDLDAVRRFLRRPECQAFADRVDAMELDPRHAAMSSSGVRERLRAGGAVDGLIPPEVERVIRRMGLYGNPTVKEEG